MRIAAALLLSASLAACAGPDVSRYAVGDPGAARTLLARAAVDGPLRLETRGTLPVGVIQGDVARAAEGGAQFLNARFSADPATATRDVPKLVVAFDWPEGGLPGDLCRADAATPAGSDPTRAAAAFCDSVGTVAAIDGKAESASADDARRLVTSLTRRLFPDDYNNSYGWGYGTGISLGGWLGSGGRSGVGVGVGF